MQQQAIRRKDYKLPADFKKGWVDALKGGEYEQVDGSFYVEGCGYCAIGVAMVECLNVDKYLLDCMSTLDNVCEKHEIPYDDIKIPWRYGSSDRPIETTTDLEEVMMEMNDGEGYSFNEIAEWIEENVEEY